MLHFKTKIMETSLIEKLDKSRYNLFKWMALGWSMSLGSQIAKDLVDSKLIIMIMIMRTVGLIGFVLLVVSSIKLIKLRKKISSDLKIKEALNNELHLLYRLKSRSYGFFAFIITLGIFMEVTQFMKVSAIIVCEVTLFIGGLSYLISALIYNKN